MNIVIQKYLDRLVEKRKKELRMEQYLECRNINEDKWEKIYPIKAELGLPYIGRVDGRTKVGKIFWERTEEIWREAFDREDEVNAKYKKLIADAKPTFETM